MRLADLHGGVLALHMAAGKRRKHHPANWLRKMWSASVSLDGIDLWSGSRHMLCAPAFPSGLELLSKHCNDCTCEMLSL